MRLIKGGEELSKSQDKRDGRSTVDELFSGIRAAIGKAEFEHALSLADQIVDWGRRQGDQETLDRGLGNRGSLLLALGRDSGVASDQQKVLLRSRDPANRYFAAYNLSVLHERRENFEKSRFYGCLALDHATQTGSSENIVPAHNQVANVLVAQSYFGEALEHYQEALVLLPDTARTDRGLVLANAGYCHLVQDQMREGFAMLFGALRMLRKLGASDWERLSCVRLSLCYGYIELGRVDRARRHGLAALRAAEAVGDTKQLQKALYLVGEAEKRAGLPLDAYSRFCRLQNEHYPDNQGLADMLMYADTHRLVNLLA